MANDALSPVEEGWGGPREKKWEANGKRAVILVEAELYELVTLMARFCRRNHKSFNQQVYAAGLQALTGQPLEALTSEVGTQRCGLPAKVARTDDEVRERLAKMLDFGGGE